MASSLLATKLRIPPPARSLTPRARLFDALERGIPSHKLTLLSAPAGYGKTTLLAGWARASRLAVAWLSVGPEDNDFERLFRSLLTAWQGLQPDIRDSPLDLLLGGISPDREAVLSAVLNGSNDLSDPLVFVLDDAHLLVDEVVCEALTFLLDHLPPTLRFVLAGRAEPSLPLARYRARQELLELRADDLAFQIDETEAFLNGVMELDLAPDEIAPLQSQLEGWVAGLQLAALTLQRRGSADAPLVSGRQRFIADYLTDDVLAGQPEDVRDFLLQTSLLERLCAPLCDVVVERAGSQSMLERLERDNLFLTPLDDTREWYRYHRLFADFLQAELRRRPDDVGRLQRRAAQWHLDHDLPEVAFRHAVEADDDEVAVAIIDRHVYPKLFVGELRTVRDWLDALPAAWREERPAFGVAQVAYLIYAGEFEAALRRLSALEQRLERADLDDHDERRRRLAMTTAIHCFIACFQNDLPRAEAYADDALRELTPVDAFFRNGVYGALGDTYRRNGRWQEAQTCYHKLLASVDMSSMRVESTHLFGALADLELRQGHLQDAAGYWRRALAVIHERETWGRLPLPLVGWVYLRMGEILYEWNELERARDYLSRGLERAELGGDARALLAGHVLAARMKLTDGAIDAAEQHLERARPLAEGTAFPDWSSRFERCQIELWLAQRRLRRALDWAEHMSRGDELLARPESDAAQLAAARVLLVRGDAASVDDALALLTRLLPAASAEGRFGVEIEALALQALGRWRSGARAEAMTALEHALRLAEPEGYARLFVDLGPPIVRLLQEARIRAVAPDYVATLLAACDADATIAGEPALPEPLSAREREVLQLLAAGLTNREIGATLFISSETVKKHTGNIYAKLGVRGRTAAVARARELDALD